MIIKSTNVRCCFCKLNYSPERKEPYCFVSVLFKMIRVDRCGTVLLIIIVSSSSSESPTNFREKNMLQTTRMEPMFLSGKIGYNFA